MTPSESLPVGAERNQVPPVCSRPAADPGTNRAASELSPTPCGC